MSEQATMTPDAPELPPEAPDATMTALYRWSTWVHVGTGAENCDGIDEQAGTNECSDPLHFHGWCRLPNPYQHRTIREEAMAAKARRIRQLRDPDTNANVILESEIEALAREGDNAKDGIVDELVAKDWWRDYMEAQADLREYEAEDGSKPWEHIERDLARWSELAALVPDERPADEFAELERHITTYNQTLDEKRQEIDNPRRAALAERDINDLLDMVRDQRIDMDANERFSHEYATLEWLHCTLRHPPDGDAVFSSRKALESQDEAVITALKETYADLERAHQMDQGGGPGNS